MSHRAWNPDKSLMDTPSLRLVVDFDVWFSRWVFGWIFRDFLGRFPWKNKQEKSTKKSKIFEGTFDQNPLRDNSALQAKSNEKVSLGVDPKVTKEQRKRNEYVTKKTGEWLLFATFLLLLRYFRVDPHSRFLVTLKLLL